MNELYGRSSETFRPTMSGWLDLIHPEDRNSAEAAITTALREHKPLRTQYRIVRPDGTIGHVESLADVTTDSADRTPRLVGIDLDIAEGSRRRNVRKYCKSNFGTLHITPEWRKSLPASSTTWVTYSTVSTYPQTS